MPRPHPLQPYVLTRDTTCRPGCPHYGQVAPLHSHFEQKPPPALPRWEPNLIWRALFRIYGNG
jgi:hypothetical protein